VRPATAASQPAAIDHLRAAKVLPVLAQILGVEND
jgi:hypothetical protein